MILKKKECKASREKVFVSFLKKKKSFIFIIKESKSK